MAADSAVSLDALRARIAAIEGQRVEQAREPSGVSALDALIGGLPRPGLVALHGEPGTGRSRLVAAVLAVRASRGSPVAWIDAERRIYPPALADLGLDLAQLLIVRPPAGHAVWAVEQVLASGCFPVVGISGVERVGTGGQRWARAAERGRCTALVVLHGPGRDLPAGLRLRVAAGGLTVLRDRRGGFGRQRALPELPAAADPWQRAMGARGAEQGPPP